MRFHLSPFCWEGQGAARRAANAAENKTATATQLHGSSQLPLTFLIFLSWLQGDTPGPKSTGAQCCHGYLLPCSHWGG